MKKDLFHRNHTKSYFCVILSYEIHLLATFKIIETVRDVTICRKVSKDIKIKSAENYFGHY